MNFQQELLILKSEIYPIISEHYPKNTHREIISLYDLIIFAILAYLHFNGVYKHSHLRGLIEEMEPFPKIRYNKLTEHWDRHGKFLLLAQEELFKKHAREYVRIRILDSTHSDQGVGQKNQEGEEGFLRSCL